MKLSSQDLKKIADVTLDCYDQNAEDFWQGTRNHDVSQNIAALLQNIESERPFTILDFGCGPGRDLKVFAEFGHIAIGLEGARHFAAMARAYSGCEVWQQDFLKLDLPENYFDGVFANASLFHAEDAVVEAKQGMVVLMVFGGMRPNRGLRGSGSRGPGGLELTTVKRGNLVINNTSRIRLMLEIQSRTGFARVAKSS